MAELDYAYLADYARIQEGTITAVGASFTHMFTSRFPTQADVALAGRVRVVAGEKDPELEIVVASVKNDVTMTVTGVIAPGPQTFVYDGKQGILFTLNIVVPMSEPDLVTVDVMLNGEKVRRLAFEMLLPADADV